MPRPKITAETAQAVWDAASDTHKQEAQNALLREAIKSQSLADLRASQDIQSHVKANEAKRDTLIAAMILLGMENIEEITKIIQIEAASPEWKQRAGWPKAQHVKIEVCEHREGLWTTTPTTTGHRYTCLCGAVVDGFDRSAHGKEWHSKLLERLAEQTKALKETA